MQKNPQADTVQASSHFDTRNIFIELLVFLGVSCRVGDARMFASAVLTTIAPIERERIFF